MSLGGEDVVVATIVVLVVAAGAALLVAGQRGMAFAAVTVAGGAGLQALSGGTGGIVVVAAAGVGVPIGLISQLGRRRRHLVMLMVAAVAAPLAAADIGVGSRGAGGVVLVVAATAALDALVRAAAPSPEARPEHLVVVLGTGGLLSVHAEAVTKGDVTWTGPAGVVVLASVVVVFVAALAPALRHRLDRRWARGVINVLTLLVAVILAVATRHVLTGTFGSAIPADRGRAATFAAGVAAVAVWYPARALIARACDWLIHGPALRPYEALARAAAGLDHAGEPGALDAIAMAARHALRVPYVLVEADGVEGAAARGVAGDPVDSVTAFDLRDGDERIGRLLVAQRDDGLGEAEQRLLSDLVRQASATVKLLRTTEELWVARQQLVVSREAERRRLRRDLHDGVAPTLAGLSLGLRAVSNLLQDTAAASALLGELAVEAERSVVEMRRLIDGLAPADLEELGLAATLHQRLRHYGDPLIPVLAIDDLPDLAPAIESAVLHIVLEAYTNAVRHSGASTCWVSVRLTDRLVIEVRDDGHGIGGGNGRVGVGLTSMRTRASELGGDLEIHSTPGGGTTVRCNVPIGTP